MAQNQVNMLKFLFLNTEGRTILYSKSYLENVKPEKTHVSLEFLFLCTQTKKILERFVPKSVLDKDRGRIICLVCISHFLCSLAIQPGDAGYYSAC